MDLISINTLQNLGMSIFHSIWQIGLICFIYFFILLTRKRLSINHKYISGLFSLALAAVLFILTFQVIKNENAIKPHWDSVNTALQISNDYLPINTQEKQVLETQKTITLFGYNKILTIVNEVAAVIGAIWILGMIFFVFRKILAYYNLKRIKNNEYNVRSVKWEKALREISTRLNLKKKVDILFSPFVNSPISFGFLKPVILFPLRLTTGLSTEEIRCILIHELAHNLRNDYFYNIFQHVIETLFFYHPGIWWISKNIRTQREIICDRIVLNNQISEKYYANTLLKLSELQLSDANLAIAARRNKSELFTRIKHIFNKSDNSVKIKRNPLLVAGVIMILIVSGFVFKNKEDIGKPTILSEEIERKLFSYGGSFAFYDFQQNKYYTTNDSLTNVRFPAYSTFKITSSLIALDLGIAADETYKIKYDSLKYPLPVWMKNHNFFKNWYKEHSIRSALEYSVNWFFNELGEQIGDDKMADYLEQLAYGNQVVREGTEQAWFNGKLKISTKEQVDFMKNLIKQDLKGVSKEAQHITKNAIPGLTNKNYSLFGKTGTGEVLDNMFIGWYVGYLETGDNTYAYALNIFGNDVNEVPVNKRQELVKDIFTDLGLIVK